MARGEDNRPDDRFAVRRVSGWSEQARIVRLRLEGSAEAARPATAPSAGPAATDELPLTVVVLDTGAVRLVLGRGSERGLPVLADPEPDAAPLSVTSAPAGLTIASERHGGYGPDPEDVTIEIGMDPFTLAVVDADGRRIFALAGAGRADEADQDDAVDELSAIDTGAPLPHPPPLAWSRPGAARPTTSFAWHIEPDERLYGFGDRDGPGDLVGTVRTVPGGAGSGPTGPANRPPLLLSSRGYGLLVLTEGAVEGSFGAAAPGIGVITVGAPTLDVMLLPGTWPRAALAAGTALTGLEALLEPAAFGLHIQPGSDDAADLGALVAEARAAGIPCEAGRPVSLPVMAAPGNDVSPAGTLRRALAAGLVAPGFWHAAVRPADELLRAPARFARQAQAALLGPLVSLPGDVLGALPGREGEARRALTILGAYARLRYRLLPYLLHCAREAAEGGLPMLRPLVLEASWDADASAVDDQFLVGRDLLVAPVFEDSAGAVVRRVYLPGYAHWYDWWTGELHEGGRRIEVAAPLDRLPLFARAGTAIPLADPRDAVGVAPVEVTRLLLFTPRDGAIGASIELPDGELMGVEQARGPKRAKLYIEGLPPTVRDLQIVGIPTTTELVDASSERVRVVPVAGPGEHSPGAPGAGGARDDLIPAPGGATGGIVVALDVGAYTTGIELRW